MTGAKVCLKDVCIHMVISYLRLSFLYLCSVVSTSIMAKDTFLLCCSGSVSVTVLFEEF